MSDDLDREWLEYGLRTDAMLIASLTIQGKQDEADSHIEATNYNNRLAEWKASR